MHVPMWEVRRHAHDEENKSGFRSPSQQPPARASRCYAVVFGPHQSYDRTRAHIDRLTFVCSRTLPDDPGEDLDASQSKVGAARPWQRHRMLAVLTGELAGEAELVVARDREPEQPIEIGQALVEPAEILDN